MESSDSLESILHKLHQETFGPRHLNIYQASKEIIEFLSNESAVSAAPAYVLREKCLYPLQLALESRNGTLAALAINGIKVIMTNERFQSQMESDNEEQWLPMQVLRTVQATPTLPDDIQVMIMKLLLQMTFSSVWCRKTVVVMKAAELCTSTFLNTSQLNFRKSISKTVLRTLTAYFQMQRLAFANHGPGSQVMMDVYGKTSSQGVRTAVQATLTQMLCSVSGTAGTAGTESVPDEYEHLTVPILAGGLADEQLLREVVMLMKYFATKLSVPHAATSASSVRHLEPLLLESIYTILQNTPASISQLTVFTDFVWQDLCPALISSLGRPSVDRGVSVQKPVNQNDVGRGSGCTTTATVSTPAARTIYSIAVELARLVGNVPSLRPVLESLYYRMLIYPPPVHRLEALKAIRILFKKPERLLDIAGPVADSSQSVVSKKKDLGSLRLVKLILDSLRECCHCSDSAVCGLSVTLVNELLATVQQLVLGAGFTDAEAQRMLDALYGKRDVKETQTSEVENNENGEERQVGVNGSDLYTAVDTESEMTSDAQPTSLSDSTCVETGEAIIQSGVQTTLISDTSAVAAVKKLHSDSEIASKYRVNISDRAAIEQAERDNAQLYVGRVVSLVRPLLDSVTPDELVQQFASDYCAELGGKQSQTDRDSIVLNADGVYVSTYALLLLNYRLVMQDYYSTAEKSVPISEEQFVDDILGLGLLLYVSHAWLSEVFRTVVRRNLLEEGGFATHMRDDVNCPLVELLRDIDSIQKNTTSTEGRGKIGGRLLSVYKDSHVDNAGVLFVADCQPGTALCQEAGKELSTRLLHTCWDSILDVLSVLVTGKGSSGISMSISLLFNAKEETRKAREAICTSLEGLQRAAYLACILGLYNQCGSTFAQLASASCVMEEVRVAERDRSSGADRSKGLPLPAILSSLGQPKLVRLHAAHSLGLDVVLSMGLEMSSHAPDCWRHVFRCCAHVAELEHSYFNAFRNPSPGNDGTRERSLFDTGGGGGMDDVLDDPSYLYTPCVPSRESAPATVPDIVHQSSLESGWDIPTNGGGVLSIAQTSKVLYVLSQHVDRLFDDAARKLNLTSAVSFFRELCQASAAQLAVSAARGSSQPPGVTDKSSEHRVPAIALHLYHLGDAVVKFIKSGRPLLHVVRMWTVVAPHLVEAACNRDRKVSMKAVACLHEAITAMLGLYQELPHFHSNESLCKPFENLLSMQMCDADVQDQVVCSICEIVEACTADIKSGWRPLFGALRSIRVQYAADEHVNEARQIHIMAVLDVFEVFLNTDNLLAFANAGVDCIQCLLKYVRGPANEGDAESDDDSDSESTPLQSQESLCPPALDYLKHCCCILASMWQMPNAPVLAGAHRIREAKLPKVIDSSQPVRGSEVREFRKLFTTDQESESLGDEEEDVGEDGVQQQQEADGGADKQGGDSDATLLDDRTLESFNDRSYVLHVWFMIVEGLTSAVTACPRRYQPKTLETVFEIVREAAKVPGPQFALHCVNHLLVPTIQAWLRQAQTRAVFSNANTLANFKQFVGLCSDLVAEFVVQFIEKEGTVKQHVWLALRQSLAVLTECVAQPTESVSRLGCACIRHCLVSCGPVMSEPMWHKAVQTLRRAVDATLSHVRLLMCPFKSDSDNFYGDLGHVKIAIRKDCTATEAQRLQQLARQVFLLDSQHAVCEAKSKEGQSYIFLIYPPGKSNADDTSPLPIKPTRVPFQHVVVGLLSHQLLVQTVGYLLLANSSHMAVSEQVTLLSSHKTSSDVPNNVKASTKAASLPGLMPFLSSRNIHALLACLRTSYVTLTRFDQCPGLKFLVQKIMQVDVAANVYKQAMLCLLFYQHALLDISVTHCLSRQELAAHFAVMQERGRTSPVKGSPAKQSPATATTADEKHKMLSVMNSDRADEQWVTARFSTATISNFTGAVVRRLCAVFIEMCERYVECCLAADIDSVADRISSQSFVLFIVDDEPVPKLQRDRSLQDMAVDKARMAQGETTDGAAEEPPVNGDETGEMQPGDRGDGPALPVDKVYSVAAGNKLTSLMNEYRRRKQAHSATAAAPKVAARSTTRKASLKAAEDDIGVSKEQLQEERKASIVKDSEARVCCWMEVLCSTLELCGQLSDQQFSVMLACTFDSVTQLVCHARHQKLREALAAWLQRVGTLHGVTALYPPADKH